MRLIHLVVGLLVLMLAVPAVAPFVDASHIQRIVMPSGQHERWIPVVAGYEVAPRPLGCDAGTITPSTRAARDLQRTAAGAGPVYL